MTDDPTRLVDDPELAESVAGDLREAIDLGLTGAEQPAGGIIERLDTSISVLEEDVDDVVIVEAPRPLARQAGLRPMVMTVALAVAVAIAALVLLLG